MSGMFIIHSDMALVVCSSFHNVTAYAIMRNAGVPIGKLHYISGEGRLIRA
jgi:hypothetical protein